MSILFHLQTLRLKTVPLFPWALLITAGMLLLTLPILSGACFSSLVQISIPSREVSILWSYLDITLLFSSYVYLIFIGVSFIFWNLDLSFAFTIYFSFSYPNNVTAIEDRSGKFSPTSSFLFP